MIAELCFALHFLIDSSPLSSCSKLLHTTASQAHIPKTVNLDQSAWQSLSKDSDQTPDANTYQYFSQMDNRVFNGVKDLMHEMGEMEDDIDLDENDEEDDDDLEGGEDQDRARKRRRITSRCESFETEQLLLPLFDCPLRKYQASDSASR